MTALVRVLDPRCDSEPADWPDFRRRAVLYPVWDYGLLRIEAWMSRNPPVLVVAERAGRVLAAMVAMVCVPGHRDAYASAPKSGGGSLRPRWAEVYQPWLAHPGFAVDPALADDAAPLLRLMERGLRDHLGVGLLGVIYRNVPLAAVAPVAGPGRMIRVVSPAAVLTNRWRSTDEWLASLSKKRRKNLRWICRKVAGDPTLRVRGDLARSDLDGAAMAALLREHRAGYGRQRFDPRSPIAGGYLDELVRRKDVHTLTYHDADGTLLAYSVTLDHPDVPMKQLWATRPRAAGGRDNLYFDNNRRAIEHMIRTGRTGLTSGRGNFEIKRTLGYSAEPMAAVIVPRWAVGGR